MRLRQLIAAGLMSFVGCSASAPAAADGSAAQPAVFLHGGGHVHPLVWARFAQEAGGDRARIVFVSATKEPSKALTETVEHFRKELKAAAVDALFAATAQEANDETLLAPLERATGVWFFDHIADPPRPAEPFDLRPYVVSKFERALTAAVDRGAAIGAGGRGVETLCRIIVRQEGDQLRFLRGFDVLADVIAVDALMRENEWERLLHGVRRHPRLLGLGVDTETVVVIKGDRLAVWGESCAHAVRWDHAFKGPMIGALCAGDDDVSLSALRKGELKRLETPKRDAAARKDAFAHRETIVADLKRGAAETAGAIVAHGGGPMPRQVWQVFNELGGGDKGRLITVPTASESHGAETESKELDTKNGFSQTTLLHTRDPAAADTAKFCDPLTRATAAWFGGGQQSRLEAAYGGTRFERELYALYDRGGVIGGTSAGAAVMSRTMIIGTRITPGSDPDAPAANEPRMGEGFDLLPGAIVDQHFLARNRWERSLRAARANPDLMGVAIDEKTAVVYRDGRLAVIGQGYVQVIRWPDGRPYPIIDSLRAGEPPVDYQALRGGAVKRVDTPR